MTEKKAKELIKATVVETIEEFKNRSMLKENISYYRKVELLLFSYASLKDAVKQKDEDIEDLIGYGLPEKSCSVVVYQTGGGNDSKAERQQLLIEKYEYEKKETERSIKRIDNALKKVKKDKYYNILKYKYLEKEENRKTEEEIAEIFKKDVSTIYRNKKRLINSLKLVIFPNSINELIQ